MPLYVCPPQKKVNSNCCLKKFTAAQVARHNTSNDAWVIVKGKVYDVTKWLTLHPKGNTLISGHLGKNVTRLMIDNQRNLISSLAPFYLGDIKSVQGVVQGPRAVPTTFSNNLWYTKNLQGRDGYCCKNNQPVYNRVWWK